MGEPSQSHHNELNSPAAQEDARHAVAATVERENAHQLSLATGPQHATPPSPHKSADASDSAGSKDAPDVNALELKHRFQSLQVDVATLRVEVNDRLECITMSSEEVRRFWNETKQTVDELKHDVACLRSSFSKSTAEAVDENRSCDKQTVDHELAKLATEMRVMEEKLAAVDKMVLHLAGVDTDHDDTVEQSAEASAVLGSASSAGSLLSSLQYLTSRVGSLEAALLRPAGDVAPLSPESGDPDDEDDAPIFRLPNRRRASWNSGDPGSSASPRRMRRATSMPTSPDNEVLSSASSPSPPRRATVFQF